MELPPLRHLVLASSSPARHQLLRSAHIAHRIEPSAASESFTGLSTREAVTELAGRKAREVAGRLPGQLVLGCDSLLELDGRPYGKPKGKEAARALWHQLAGREATLWTGHVLLDGSSKRALERAVPTTVSFGWPSEPELASYLESGEATRLAGGFSIEGRAAPFLRAVAGEPANVMGLSLVALREMLAELGLALAEFDWEKRGVLVRPLESDDDRRWLTRMVEETWGLPLVSLSGLHDPGTLPGIVAESCGERLGVACYRLDEKGLEVVLLQSLLEGAGIGGRLLEGVRRLAREASVRLWLITTDENMGALSFYLRQGLRLVAVHEDFISRVAPFKPRLLQAEVFRDAFELEQRPSPSR